MAVRHRKRSKHKFLGTRKWGRGNIKHGRGKGCRGGKGFAGSSKHKWIWVIKNYPNHFGGESNRPLLGKPKPINLWAINKLVSGGKVEKNASGKFEVKLEGFKVLGVGKLEFPCIISAYAFSESAVEKIKAAGGEAKPAE